MESATVSWHFGARLRAIRQARGLSVRELANRLGIGHATIVRWEQQAHAPKLPTVERLAGALTCGIGDLLGVGDQIFTGADGGDRSGTTGDEMPVTEQSPNDTATLQRLRADLADAVGERDRLRQIITDLAEAIQGDVDPRRAMATRTKILSEAAEIRLRRLEESTAGIGVEDSEDGR